MHTWLKAEEIEVGDVVLAGTAAVPELIFANRVDSVDVENLWVWVNVDNTVAPLRFRRGSSVTVLRGI